MLLEEVQGGPQGGPTGPGAQRRVVPDVLGRAQLTTHSSPLLGLPGPAPLSADLLAVGRPRGWVPGIALLLPTLVTHPVYPPWYHTRARTTHRAQYQPLVPTCRTRSLGRS